MLRRAFLLLLSVAAASSGASACGENGPSGPQVEVRFSLEEGAGFWDRPFPMDIDRGEDGHPLLLGFPNPRSVALIDAYVTLAREGTDGFSPTGPIYFPFDGPIAPANLPADAAASLEPDATVFLVDVDPDSPERGRRAPIRTSWHEPDEPFRPANLLQVLPLPGMNLREHTTYAVVVRTSLGTTLPGGSLRAPASLRALLEDRAPPGALGESARRDFAPLRVWLAEAGIPPAGVAAAVVYRTGDVTSKLAAAVEAVRGGPAPVPVEEPTLLLEMPEYCAYAGVWAPPQYQDGTPVYEYEGGRMIFDEHGAPVVQRTDRAPFVVAVPKRVMPAAGFPLLFWVNGTGGVSRQVIDRGYEPPGGGFPEPGTGPAQVAAMRGWGASGVAGPITPERVGEAESMGGFAMYAFFNPVAMRDNFFQAVLEHVLFRRLVLALRIDPSDCPGADASAAPDGLVRYDPDHQVVMGQSLGSYLAGMLAALDPGFDAAILTGAGGSWVEFPFGVETPVNLASLLSSAVRLPSVETLDRFHPVIAIFDLSCGPSDNTHYVDEILRRPRPGHEAPHVLVVEGDDDRFIGPDLQRALVSAVGVDLVGADVGPADRRIEDRVLLAGGRRRDPPVRENVATPLGPRTAGVVRWLPDAEGAGHYVTFQIDGPQHQYACFLETLYETGIPTIVAGTGSRTSACH